MKINEQIILNMVAPYMVENSITWNEFDRLFAMLSRTEQYGVTNVLAAHSIDLRDGDDTRAEACCAGAAGGVDTAEVKPLYDNRVFGGNDPTDCSRSSRNLASLNNELLAKAYREGNKEALEQLCLRNKNLVMKYAAQYTGMYGSSLTTDELFSAGMTGLITAAEHYEYDLGYAFTTYAVWWIRQEIFRENENNGFTIRIPNHMHEKIRKVTKIENELIGSGMTLTDRIAAIADALKDTKMSMSEEEVLECIRLRQQIMRCTSLDMPVNEEGDTFLGDLISGETKDNPESMLDRIALKSDIGEMLSRLTFREQMIIRERYGLDGLGQRTLEEIGSEMGVSRECIRQIEQKAMRKLRIRAARNGMDEYLMA